jgi:lyso-ornithine lipid O-acyltransferase
MAVFLGQVRATLILTGFVLYTASCLPFQYLLHVLKLRARYWLPMVFHRVLCRYLGIRVRVRGTVVKGRPVLMVANHSSYFDIPVLATVTELSFVAKSEVASWPGVGLMARAQNTVFVERERRTKAGEQRNEIQRRLANNETLVLFPEGTSHDGNSVLPFKSALMGAAQWNRGDAEKREPILVQPVSVAYTRVHGLPMGRFYRPWFTWYGDMPFGSHVFKSFVQGPFDVDIILHPPVTLEEFGSRKKLADYCWRVVSSGLSHSLAGREGMPPPAPREVEEAPYMAPAPVPAQ